MSKHGPSRFYLQCQQADHDSANAAPGLEARATHAQLAKGYGQLLIASTKSRLCRDSETPEWEGVGLHLL